MHELKELVFTGYGFYILYSGCIVRIPIPDRERGGRGPARWKRNAVAVSEPRIHIYIYVYISHQAVAGACLLPELARAQRLLQRLGKWQVLVDPQHSPRLVTARFATLHALSQKNPFRPTFSSSPNLIEKKLRRSSIGKLMSLVEYTIRIKRQMNRNALYAGNIGM